MRRRLKKADFDALADGELGAACFEPLVPLIRAKPDRTKREVYRGLTPGQRALFMYHVYVDHAKRAPEQFYWWTAHYAVQPDAWAELIGGLRAFGADGFIALLEETKAALPFGKLESAALGDLADDAALSAAIDARYDRFRRIASDTAEAIGRRIRSAPLDFVEFEE